MPFSINSIVATRMVNPLQPQSLKNAQQAVQPSAVQPSALRCLVRIEFIKPDWEEQAERRSRSGSWIPPIQPSECTRVGRTPWLRWAPGALMPVTVAADVTASMEDYDCCSLFYDSECDHFLGVPYDCMTRSVKTVMQQAVALGGNGWAHGWRRLTFEHNTYRGRNLSVLNFDDAYPVLAAYGSSTWMPELIPTSYNFNVTIASQPACPGTTIVAGKLALLFAFTAFSCAQENLYDVIKSALRPPDWVPHRQHYQRESVIETSHAFVI